MSLTALASPPARKSLVPESAKIRAAACVAAAWAREVDGRLRPTDRIGADAAEFVAAACRFASTRNPADFEIMARLAATCGAVVMPAKGRGPVKLLLESGKTFEAIPGVFLVA